MNANEQRIAIAEFCGWVAIRPATAFDEERKEHVRIIVGYSPENPFPHDGPEEELPDYLNDLNAMHEAESKLEKPEAYASRLGPILLRDKSVSNMDGTTAWHFAFAHATAAQRAEALLKTLGKWKTDPVAA